MTKDEIIAILKQARAELAERGIQHAQLFGSVARGDNGPDSDIDIAVTLDPEARIDILDFVGLERHLAELLGRKVDLVELPVSKPHLREEIERDCVLAF